VTTPTEKPGIFEPRPLLDMALQKAVDRRADRGLAGIADLLECLADRDAVPVGDRKRVLDRDPPRKAAGAPEPAAETTALLVAPVDQLDRRLGLDPGIVQHPDHLEGREHAVGAVEPAAGRLAVEMAADQHRRPVRIPALPPREDIAEPVDPDVQSRGLAPFDEAVARRLVDLGQREAPDPARGRRADLAHGHQAVPEPLAVDPKIAGFRHDAPPLLCRKLSGDPAPAARLVPVCRPPRPAYANRSEGESGNPRAGPGTRIAAHHLTSPRPAARPRRRRIQRQGTRSASSPTRSATSSAAPSQSHARPVHQALTHRPEDADLVHAILGLRSVPFASPAGGRIPRVAWTMKQGLAG
jgi:hypothetical protein